MKKYQELSLVILLFVIQSIFHYFIGTTYNLASSEYFKIYGFLFFITLIAIVIVEFIDASFKEHLGFVFLGIIVFKFLTGIFFMRMTTLGEEPQKYHFLIGYLGLIFILTIYVARKLLKTDKKH